MQIERAIACPALSKKLNTTEKKEQTKTILLMVSMWFSLWLRQTSAYLNEWKHLFIQPRHYSPHSLVCAVFIITRSSTVGHQHVFIQTCSSIFQTYLITTTP